MTIAPLKVLYHKIYTPSPWSGSGGGGGGGVEPPGAPPPFL